MEFVTIEAIRHLKPSPRTVVPTGEYREVNTTAIS